MQSVKNGFLNIVRVGVHFVHGLILVSCVIGRPVTTASGRLAQAFWLFGLSLSRGEKQSTPLSFGIGIHDVTRTAVHRNGCTPAQVHKHAEAVTRQRRPPCRGGAI
jgi:hypothetical protein